MSRPQFILAVQSKLLSEMGLNQGLNPLSLEEFIAAAQSSLIIGQREALEVDESLRQLLPYVVITQADPTGGPNKFVVYQRGKGVGESRLLGKVSIGFGGHIDLADVVHTDSVIDLTQTIAGALQRELQEEVILDNPARADDGDDQISLFSLGTLTDNSDSVGLVHVGLVMNAQIGEGVVVTCAEEELTTLPMMTAKELLDSGLPLENWTRTIAEFYVELGV